MRKNIKIKAQQENNLTKILYKNMIYVLLGKLFYVFLQRNKTDWNHFRKLRLVYTLAEK